METNTRRFGTPGITAVIGDFMEMDLAEYIKLNCKKMDKAEGEEIAKIIKNIETDEDDEGVELTLDEIL